ncbi:MAG: imidazole glycerol phosphate synthase subunit HisH [Candidatus Nanopelagicales bacterium]|nr:imidazole glycerol phosphate synthase subunit HisH [Candidatus Nanopelagicales bacterium]
MASRPRVVVFDYGFGNVRSAEKALNRVGADAVITADADLSRECDGLVVPGVGAFAACMRGLADAGGPDIIADRIAMGRPVLGICVGMQVMFSLGVEHGEEAAGLDIWPGTVELLHAEVLPHMGWNTVEAPAGSALFRGVADQRFYFVHSYGLRQWAELAGLPGAQVALSEHGEKFAAAVQHGVVAATQFHPEKSGAAGLKLLANWLSSMSRPE